MKFYGHAEMQQNQLRDAALQTLSQFPSTPVVGQFAFINSIVYICVTAGPLPVWVPLTREITAFTHTQNTPAVEWNINHGMNTSSVVTQIYAGDGLMVIPDDIEIVDPDNVTVTFNTALSGKAVVLTGHFDGNPKPTYAYTHYQNSADDTWVIVHGLGYNPIIRVFIGNQEVQPSSIVHDSTNQVTITFSSPQVGYAQLI